MNLERMVGMLESFAKGTWQSGRALWKKESIGASAQYCLFWHKEPTAEPWSWETGHQDTHLLPRAMLAKQTQQGMYSMARSARLTKHKAKI